MLVALLVILTPGPAINSKKSDPDATKFDEPVVTMVLKLLAVEVLALRVPSGVMVKLEPTLIPPNVDVVAVGRT